MKTTAPILRELRGELCQCGESKEAGQTFCRACYAKLGRSLQVPLWRRIGAGYEQAYAAARAFLRGEAA
jgi:hypothetical protein